MRVERFVIFVNVLRTQAPKKLNMCVGIVPSSVQRSHSGHCCSAAPADVSRCVASFGNLRTTRTPVVVSIAAYSACVPYNTGEKKSKHSMIDYPQCSEKDVHSLLYSLSKLSSPYTNHTGLWSAVCRPHTLVSAAGTEPKQNSPCAVHIRPVSCAICALCVSSW